jgi:dihydrofolate reductase
MGNVTLWMQISLDGRTHGPHGELDWPIVEPELHQYFNDELRTASTFLYGRKVYEGMAAFWPTADQDPVGSPRLAEYAQIWKPMPKLVFSRTLEQANWNARVVSENIADEVAQLKRSHGNHLLFGGADIASTFIRLGLVDDYRLFVHPVVLGAGTRLFGDLDERVQLELVASRTFDGAVVHAHYRPVR